MVKKSIPAVLGEADRFCLAVPDNSKSDVYWLEAARRGKRGKKYLHQCERFIVANSENPAPDEHQAEITRRSTVTNTSERLLLSISYHIPISLHLASCPHRCKKQILIEWSSTASPHRPRKLRDIKKLTIQQQSTTCFLAGSLQPSRGVEEDLLMLNAGF